MSILNVIWYIINYNKNMNPLYISIISIGLIFLSNVIGSAAVFLIKNKLSPKVSAIILGLASGIMFSASVFGLIMPAIEEAKTTYANIVVVPIVIGFLLGALLLASLDKILPHFHISSNEEEGIKTTKLSQQIKFIIAVTMHNIPEGLAVGFACGLAFNSSDNPALMWAALSLGIGISIQNVPEAAAVSIPLRESDFSRTKSFGYGVLSGVVEPIFAVIGIFIATSLTLLMPWLLAFAAGAMIYVTVDELLPSSRETGHTHIALWTFLIGFLFMLVLELVL